MRCISLDLMDVYGFKDLLGELKRRMKIYLRGGREGGREGGIMEVTEKERRGGEGGGEG